MAKCAQLVHKVAQLEGSHVLTLAAADERPEETGELEHHVYGQASGCRFSAAARENDEGDARAELGASAVLVLCWRLICLSSLPPRPSYARAPARCSCTALL